MNPGAEKQAMRAEFLRRRRELDDAARREAEARIVAQLRDWPEFRRARAVAAYRSDGSEPELTALFDRRFAFPRWNGAAYELAMPGAEEGSAWRTGRYGLPEPTGEALADADASDVLWLVPGVAFDAAGRRLGRGGGWYDRMLETAKGVTAGVFFSVQESDRPVPCGAHDRVLEWIVTEKIIRRCSDGSLADRREAAVEVSTTRKEV